MKKSYEFSAKVVASAALLGNLDYNVIKRMVEYITSRTTDNNIICSLLRGLVVDAKISNKEKLAEIIGKFIDENICEIKDLEVIVADQNIRVVYVCKRYAKSPEETRCYETRRKQDDAYTYEVQVQDSYRIDINDVDFENSIDFETI